MDRGGSCRTRRAGALLALCAALGVFAGALSGCSAGPELMTVGAEACVDCHEDVVEARTGTPHTAVACVSCHDGADGDHTERPEEVRAVIDWTIDSCARCHEYEALTYLYDDNAKPGPFGGSIREPHQPKVDEFPLYDTIVAGHGFTRDYAEEGAHLYMLEDHAATLRGKSAVCLQCKSTAVAYAWYSGLKLEVDSDVEVALTHTATDNEPARSVTIPAGSTVSYSTDRESRVASITATLADGTAYSIPVPEGADGAEAADMTWAVSMAAIDDTLPYGAGCNHCHDPHSTAPRIIREMQLQAMDEGGPGDTGGVNPYREGSPKTIEESSATDRRIMLCAQCHVEYTCGRSTVDGVVRDSYGWAKAGDLHDLYQRRYGYLQDWSHALIGEPLIKSQHPETELYWQSRHYVTGASCSDCHMPLVRADGRTFRSHWFTSPYKYHDAELYRAFANATRIDRIFVDRPCARCHADKTAQGIAWQERVYERQEPVQQLIARSATLLGQVRQAREAGAEVDEAAWNEAVDEHRQAHVLWENLIVSENSMGFHNYEEVMSAMATAQTHAEKAISLAQAMLPE